MIGKIANSALCVLLSLSVSTVALGQEGAPGAAPGRAAGAAGRGAAAVEAGCDQVVSYGQVQAAAAPMAPPVQTVAAPDEGPAAPARAGRRGAAGGRGAAAPARTISIPDVPMMAFAPVEAPAAPAGTQFGGVSGVGLLSNGHLIVYQRKAQNELMEYDSNNRLLRTFDENIASRPHGMRIDKNDNIWITDVSCNTVMKLSPTGNVLMTLGTKGKTGTWDEAAGAHLFNQPTDVGFGPTGDIFVSTGHGGADPRIVRFDKNGKFITTWSMKHADGSAANIHTMIVDKTGNVFSADREIKTIFVFDSNGKHLREIHMPNLICGLYIDKKGGLWMTAGQDGMLMRLDWSGKILGWTGKVGKGQNEYGEAHYMVLTPDLKTIYVSDTVNNNVVKLQATN